MNYLAHAYLSFGIPAIATGNLISDFVKGKHKFDYPADIQQGIVLHRAIDTFTDEHAVTRKAKSFFREDYRLYSGPIVDVIYDYFLANDSLIFSTDGAAAGLGLKAFAQKTYEQIAAYQALLPERFARMFYYMRTQDWLYNYRFKQGIFDSLSGLSRRAVYMGSPEQAGRLFEMHYSGLETCYKEFFPELQEFALRTLQQLQAENG